jgi:hypothetical protein
MAALPTVGQTDRHHSVATLGLLWGVVKDDQDVVLFTVVYVRYCVLNNDSQPSNIDRRVSLVSSFGD